MENKNPNNKKPFSFKNFSNTTLMLIALVTISIFFLFIRSQAANLTNKEISYDEFIQMVEQNLVKTVEINSNRIRIFPKQDIKSFLPSITYYTKPLHNPDLVNYLLESDVTIKGVRDETPVSDWLFTLAMFVMVCAPTIFLFRRMGGGIMNVGRSNAKVYVQKETGVRFKNVAGQDEAEESLKEIVDFLHNPHKYTKIGAKLPKGALLVGPPGTGKTLLAKAVAGEAKVPFYSLTGSDFVEMFVGVGASRVRDLFKQAQQTSPCIIFIDEIDAIGQNRNARLSSNDEREQTLNQLLSEMDGFDSSKGLVVLAATNRPESLDAALLRPGRFDRRIIVDKPDLKGRENILVVHAKDVAMDSSVDFNAIALSTPGAVGSDLANMINEAAINAVKAGREAVSQADLFEAIEVVLAGKEKKDRIMNAQEKRRVAYHEVGHALVTALQKDSEPVQKITIVPRTMGALGYVISTPEEEKYLTTKEDLLSEMIVLLAGRAAEQVVFGSISTGAANDIERATKIARSMVTRFGMSDEFGLINLETIESQYLDPRAVLQCAEETAAKLDRVVQDMLNTAYQKAVSLLENHRDQMDRIALYLLEKESITGKEFMSIFRQETLDEDQPQEAKKEENKEENKQENILKEDIPKDENNSTIPPVTLSKEENEVLNQGEDTRV
ncbi:ATP-dependent zinc metalloprotease FtsH [Clostridia bacterium]|nr:ATP-dependent zinc metalloprotease FtsH [Clostridia bacterium]